MTPAPRDLYQSLLPHAVWHGRFGVTSFLYMPEAAFEPYKTLFEKDKYQHGKWRYGGLFFNLHAVPVADGLVNIHTDYGNPNQHYLLGGLVHGIVDCPLWTLLSLWRLGRLDSRPSLADMKRLVGAK